MNIRFSYLNELNYDFSQIFSDCIEALEKKDIENGCTKVQEALDLFAKVNKKLIDLKCVSVSVEKEMVHEMKLAALWVINTQLELGSCSDGAFEKLTANLRYALIGLYTQLMDRKTIDKLYRYLRGTLFELQHTLKTMEFESAQIREQVTEKLKSIVTLIKTANKAIEFRTVKHTGFFNGYYGENLYRFQSFTKHPNDSKEIEMVSLLPASRHS